MREDYVLFTFDSTHTAMAANRLLKELGAVMMPTLREISVSCGISLRLRRSDGEAAQARLDGAELEGWQLYAVAQEGGKPQCTLLRERSRRHA